MRNLTPRFASVAMLAMTVLAAASSASAALVTYSAGDAGASTRAQLVNATAAQASFIAATPAAQTITFEGAIPAGVTISGSYFWAISCGDPGALNGFNTTIGGQTFLCMDGGTVTFTFTTPIDSFGLFVTGLQSAIVPNETITFSDGSPQSISPVSISSGGAFLGFTDAGKSITSVSYNATGDLVGLDDIRFGLVGAAAVPEPETLALFGVALVGFATARRRRR